MNVKPGMQARVIKDDFASVVGMECLILDNFWIFDGVHMWECRFKDPIPVMDLINGKDWVAMGKRQKDVFMPDSWLRPAIDKPIVQEILEEEAT